MVDILVPIWRAKLTNDDKDRYVLTFTIKDGDDVKGTFVVIDIGKCGDRISNDVSLKLLRTSNANNNLDSCSFKEFREYYGEYILHLRDINRTMDIFGR